MTLSHLKLMKSVLFAFKWKPIPLIKNIKIFKFISPKNSQDTGRNGYRRWFPKLLKETIIWRLQVQSSLLASNNTGILSHNQVQVLTESEQATPVDSIKGVVWSSMKVPESNKHLKAGGHIGRNIVKITIKMETIVRKPLMIKIYTYTKLNWLN